MDLLVLSATHGNPPLTGKRSIFPHFPLSGGLFRPQYPPPTGFPRVTDPLGGVPQSRHPSENDLQYRTIQFDFCTLLAGEPLSCVVLATCLGRARRWSCGGRAKLVSVSPPSSACGRLAWRFSWAVLRWSTKLTVEAEPPPNRLMAGGYMRLRAPRTAGRVTVKRLAKPNTIAAAAVAGTVELATGG